MQFCVHASVFAVHSRNLIAGVFTVHFKIHTYHNNTKEQKHRKKSRTLKLLGVFVLVKVCCMQARPKTSPNEPNPFRLYVRWLMASRFPGKSYALHFCNSTIKLALISFDDGNITLFNFACVVQQCNLNFTTL